MRIDELNLDFLWTRETTPSSERDNRNHFNFWKKDIFAYEQFIQKESLPMVIQLLIRSHTDRFPTKDYWNYALYAREDSFASIRSEGEYQVLDGAFLSRDDIAKHKWINRQDIYRRPFLYERVFEFRQNQELLRAVEEAIDGKSYVRQVQEDSIIIRIKDSPVSEIEVSPSRFRITIAPEECENILLPAKRIEDINLEFLWAQGAGMVLDGPDPFWEKWGDEKFKYLHFLEHGPLKEMVRLVIMSFRDQYPRSLLFLAMLERYEPGREVSRGKSSYLHYKSRNPRRNDMKAYAWKSREHFQTNDGFADFYDFEHEFEFREEIDLQGVVEETLNGKEFQKSVSPDAVKYTIRESPIAKIELWPRRLKMTLNSKYFRRR